MYEFDLKAKMMATLDDHFNIEVNGEKVEQGFTRPCFVVRQLNINHEREIGDYQRANYTFMIEYFPDEQEQNKACREMEFKLMNLFRFWEAMRIKPASISSAIVDGVLQFDLTLNVRYLIDNGAGEMIQNLEMESEVKNG